MLRHTLCLSLAVVAVLFLPVEAGACSCVPPDQAASFDAADVVFTAEITGSIANPPAGQLRFAATVKQGLKGCLSGDDPVVVQTASTGAACGVSLQIGQSYYLNGHLAGAAGGLPVLAVGLCDYNVLEADLTADDRAFLEAQPRSCGEAVICKEGLVHCFLNPCDVSSCDVPGAKCLPNYCGGCRAEWYDVTGARACTGGGCAGDDDCPPSSWCRSVELFGSECVPYAGPGEPCGGAEPLVERCQPGLVCVPDMVEAPIGRCAACSFDGEPYQVGDTFPAGDGCNTCFCSNDGTVGCTLMLCLPKCDYLDPQRSYVSRDPEVCARIRFTCMKGGRPFGDECGCGCEPAGPGQK